MSEHAQFKFYYSQPMPIMQICDLERVNKKEKRVSNSSIPVCKHYLQSTKYTCMCLDSVKDLSQQLHKSMSSDLSTL